MTRPREPSNSVAYIACRVMLSDALRSLLEAHRQEIRKRLGRNEDIVRYLASKFDPGAVDSLGPILRQQALRYLPKYKHQLAADLARIVRRDYPEIWVFSKHWNDIVLRSINLFILRLMSGR
jgi:hypothetical protein